MPLEESYLEIKGTMWYTVHIVCVHLRYSQYVFIAILPDIQTKSEGKLFERLKLNWKFGTLISTIIQKSWPKDHQGKYQEDEEVVLKHLLSWTAAKDIFQLHGIKTILIIENMYTPKKLIL